VKKLSNFSYYFSILKLPLVRTIIKKQAKKMREQVPQKGIQLIKNSNSPLLNTGK
jgi:hypothetical protein